MFKNAIVQGLLAVALMASAVSVQADVFNMGGTISGGTWTGLASLQFVTVGNPGNVADPATGGTLGSVGYTYQMGKYDVTTAQYVAFLNSVATKSDPYGLYSSVMASDMPTVGISRSGNPGNYSYSLKGNGNMPEFDVSWGDAARFCNWLQNGQPTSGTEGTGTTETGAYPVNGAMSNTQLMAVASPTHSGTGAATYFLPTENEWYKAAYYSGGGANSSYYTYPTRSNSPPGNLLALALTASNEANYDISGYTDPTNYLTPVGEFVLSPGPYGTYDMGGDVSQWNEANIFSGSMRGYLGGSWGNAASSLASSYGDGYYPTLENDVVGFRVASSVAVVPEPGSIVLLLAGGVGLLVFAWRRRRQAA